MLTLFRNKTFVILLALAVLGVSIYGARRLWRMGVAADVTRYTPDDMDGMVWIPRVDHFTKSLFEFTRGVQEARRLRDFLKPETGVDLGDPEGIRRAGIDPEAGLVVFSKKGMLHVLFGVEDEGAILTALKSKFKNLGFAEISIHDTHAEMHVVPSKKSGVHAAFKVENGLLVLVYRGRGDDPVGAVVAVHGSADKKGFFATPRYAELQKKLGKEGPLLYANGARLALNADASPRMAWLDKLKLHSVVDAFVRARTGAWLSKVSYGAARITMSSCAASIRGTLTASDGAELLPIDWLLSADSTGPDFGKMLPRDTVAMTRLNISVAPIARMVDQVARLGAGMKQLGNILGLGGKGEDPIATLLGNMVHPQLADRHVVKDLLNHLSGRFSVAIVGLNQEAQFNDVLRIKSHPIRWLNAVQLVAAVELNDAPGFWKKWWDKRELLTNRGYRVTTRESGARKVIEMTRGCRSKKQPCEKYAAILHENLLLLMTGADTAKRVTEVMDGKVSSYYGLTREKLAQGILEHEPMLMGGYFSFDGLLRALRNRNLPGGATRYLGQFYELAVSFDTAGGNAGAELLLTR